MHTISNEAALAPAHAPSHRGAGKGRIAALLVRICDIGLNWLELRRQRRALQALDSYQLKDIGLTRADVAAEICKPFWRQ